MSIRSQRDIYRILEKHLREAEHPLTCVDLMDIHEVEQEALREFGGDKRNATNKLSDALGFMWRRQLLTRYPASGEGGQLARYAYVWSEALDARPTKPLPNPVIKSRPGVVVEEKEDGIMIEFEKFFVFIRPK